MIFATVFQNYFTSNRTNLFAKLWQHSYITISDFYHSWLHGCYYLLASFSRFAKGNESHLIWLRCNSRFSLLLFLDRARPYSFIYYRQKMVNWYPNEKLLHLFKSCSLKLRTKFLLISVNMFDTCKYTYFTASIACGILFTLWFTDS